MKFAQKGFLFLFLIVFVFGSPQFAKAIPNTAPVLDAVASPTMVAIYQPGAPGDIQGTLVSDLVDFPDSPGLDNVNDLDDGALLGIAVTAVNSADLICHYSLDDGTTWHGFGTPSATTTRLLAADSDNRVYCQKTVSDGTFPDALTFRAWDQTSGTDGGTADTTTNGGSTAFSSVTDNVSFTINAVNGAPSASNLSAPETYTEDTPLNLTDIVITDDSLSLQAYLTLSDPEAGSLSTSTSGLVTSTYNPETGQWHANGARISLNRLLAGVIFTPAPNYNSTFTIATAVNDGISAVTGSKTMNGIAADTVPGVPTSLTVTALPQSHVHLSWTAPEDDGGDEITGYRIDRESPVDSVWGTIVDDTESDATTYNDQYVLPGVEYNYRVAAINSVDVGEFGDSASVTTPGATSGASCVADAYWNFDEGEGTTAIESVEGYDGTLVNGPTYSTDVPPVDFTDSHSLLFDEDSDQKVIFSRSATTTYSVSMWIKPLGQTNEYGSLISQNTDIGLYYLGDDIGNVAWPNKISNYNGDGDHVNVTALSLDTWHHIALVNDDGHATFYLDGVADGSSDGSPAVNFNTLGSDGGHEAFNGYIDDVRIYDSLLTASQVESLADGNENCDGSTATPTPVARHHSSGGGSLASRVTNLVAMNKTQEAKDLVEKYQNNPQNIIKTLPPIIRDLEFGLSGDDVKQLQIFLNSHGFLVATTGPGSSGNETNFFGALTRSALAEFQKANGITPTAGYFGPKTRAFLAGMKTTL
ncbi:MAG: peptidoglycan-binding protein [Candidatus Pacebacteria bacterium]|nr:peptidoglycan-binding protein [Candidatus Paceibacterota bacterium]